MCVCVCGCVFVCNDLQIFTYSYLFFYLIVNNWNPILYFIWFHMVKLLIHNLLTKQSGEDNQRLAWHIAFVFFFIRNPHYNWTSELLSQPFIDQVDEWFDSFNGVVKEVLERALLYSIMIIINACLVTALVSCSISRICYTDSIGAQEDQYPPNIAVKVNQSYCHVPVSRPSSVWEI